MNPECCLVIPITHWLEAEGKGLSLEFFGLTWVRKGVYISYT